MQPEQKLSNSFQHLPRSPNPLPSKTWKSFVANAQRARRGALVQLGSQKANTESEV